MTRPSGVSSHCPPRPLISADSAASRSVSWPRRCAMPRELRHRAVGGQRGQRRDRGRQLADVVQVDIEPAVELRALHLQIRIYLWRTAEPSFSRMPRMASAGWMLTCGQPVDPHDPAADHCRGQERHGVGQVGLDDPVPRGDRAGRDPPAVGLRRRRRRRRRRAASTPSSRRAAPTAPTRRCARSSARR